MVKLYSDPKNPETKKWTVYVPTEQYKEFKKLSVDLEENVNQLVSDSFAITLALSNHMKKLKKSAAAKNMSLENYFREEILPRIF